MKKIKRKVSWRARTLIDIDALDMLPVPGPGIGALLVPDRDRVTGSKLREFRNGLNLNQKQLAKLFRISKNSLQAIESSRDPVPDRIGECLDILRQALRARATSETRIPRIIKKLGGRPIVKRTVYVEARRLRDTERLPWSKIAQRLDPKAFASNPRNAGEAIRRGVERLPA
jgi:transcriptional regulator with XRE-family HTH domain